MFLENKNISKRLGKGAFTINPCEGKEIMKCYELLFLSEKLDIFEINDEKKNEERPH